MSRWFRWYEGTAEDAKLRLVAKRSRVTVRDVIAVWAVILENASSIEHPGVCSKGTELIQIVLDFEDGQLEPIIENLAEMGMIERGEHGLTICNWGKRQFKSDVDLTATERQRRKRERDKRTSHAPVTRDSRNQNRTETENNNMFKPDGFEQFWTLYRRKQAKGRALKAFKAAIKKDSPDTIIEGLKRYTWPNDPKYYPLPATWLNDRRWEDLDLPDRPKANGDGKRLVML